MSTTEQKHFPPQVVRVAQDYVNAALPTQTRQAVYKSASTGREETIEDMHPTHAKNALAKILRELAGGKMAYLGDDGVIKFI